MKKTYSLTLVALLMFISSASYSNTLYRGNRYSLVETTVSNYQSDILSVVISVTFPPSVHTVGDSIEHLLLRSGYRMASDLSSDPSLSILLDLPLPDIHRSMVAVSLRSALRMITGDAWELIEDPVNRLISFELIDQFKKGVLR